MKEKKKLSLPAWIFIGMLAGIVAGLIFAFAGSLKISALSSRKIIFPRSAMLCCRNSL